MATLEEDPALSESFNENDLLEGADDYLSGGEAATGDSLTDQTNLLDEDEQMAEDAELEAIRASVREMEQEADSLKEKQMMIERQMGISASSSTSSIKGPAAILTPEEKADIDVRSCCVRNVDYGATASELETHFHGCGSINRVTILVNKFDGHPKGFAYVEFSEKDSVQMALRMDETLFRGRLIKVEAKRTNVHGMSSTDRPPRGRGRGRGRVVYVYGGGYRGGRSRGYRSRRANSYAPY